MPKARMRLQGSHCVAELAGHVGEAGFGKSLHSAEG